MFHDISIPVCEYTLGGRQFVCGTYEDSEDVASEDRGKQTCVCPSIDDGIKWIMCAWSAEEETNDCICRYEGAVNGNPVDDFTDFTGEPCGPSGVFNTQIVPTRKPQNNGNQPQVTTADPDEYTEGDQEPHSDTRSEQEIGRKKH